MTRFMLTFAAALTAMIAAVSQAGDDEVESGTVGTGIMGVITGLGSIHVNGLTIEVPETMVATSSMGNRPAGVLRVGETVTVEAARQGDDLTATRIRNYYPLIAPIEAIEDDRIQIIGLKLDVSGVDRRGLQAGDWVAVSGLWRGRTVIVSDLRPIEPRDEIVINGTFAEDRKGVQKVGPVPLDRRYIAHAEPGDHLRVTGTWSAESATFAPIQIEAGLFSRTLNTLVIEGYMSTPDRQGAYSIYGSGVVVYTNDPGMHVPKERSVFCVDQRGSTTITQILSLDMSPTERQSLLEALSRDGGPSSVREVPCN